MFTIAYGKEADKDTLQKIAQLTGGKYYAADDAKKFRDIYDEIDHLEKTEVEMKKFSRYKELYPWWLGPALPDLMSSSSTDIFMTNWPTCPTAGWDGLMFNGS